MIPSGFFVQCWPSLLVGKCLRYDTKDYSSALQLIKPKIHFQGTCGPRCTLCTATHKSDLGSIAKMKKKKGNGTQPTYCSSCANTLKNDGTCSPVCSAVLTSQAIVSPI